jgi:hypothetical protein
MTDKRPRPGAFVSISLRAGAYPNVRKSNQVREHVHCARIADNGEPRPICSKVRPGSFDADPARMNRRPVTCPPCITQMRRMAVTVEVKP